MCLKKFDATRDVAGTFYALGDWRAKHAEIRRALECAFGVTLRNNGNSFASCFQFEEKARPDRPSLRIKVYNKLLHLLQSDSAAKRVGMNTNAIYYPSMRMQKVMQNFQNEGVTRIEITYSADSVPAENELPHTHLADRAKRDIGKVLEILNQAAGIGYRLGMMELLQAFADNAKQAQLFIQQH